MELSVSRRSQLIRAVSRSLAVIAAIAIAVAALALSGGLFASGTRPSTRPAVQAPAVSEPSLYGECLNAPPLKGETC